MIWNIFVSHKETCFSNRRMYIAVVFLILTSYCLLVIFDLHFVFPVAVSTVCFALPYSIQSVFFGLALSPILSSHFVTTTCDDYCFFCSYQSNTKNRNFTQTYIVAVEKSNCLFQTTESSSLMYSVNSFFFFNQNFIIPQPDNPT